MGKLIRLELFNFKSYKGHHTLLFGDSYFTSIIGPNGSGKSNSMDAISFVLGIKSSHLRSAHLKDLVYRGRVLKTSKIMDDGSAAEPATNGHANVEASDDESPSQSQKAGLNDPKSAWVMAVYEDEAGEEQKWKRTITNSGSSEYRINDRVVSALQYNESLESENILIKARNFLVFQGDVEQIASQSPKDLTRLIEQISGSLEYKAEYEKLQEEAEQAAENQTYNLHRRRGINSEIKQYQEQKKEAEAYQNKAEERDDAILTQILWKLFHFQRVMEESTASIHEHQENLKEYKRGVEKYEKTLQDVRSAHSKVAKHSSKVERNMKKKEKEIEDKENSMVPVQEKIDTQERTIRQVQKRVHQIAGERDEQGATVKIAEKELAKVEKAQTQFEDSWQETLKKQGKQLSDTDFKEYNVLKSKVVTKTSSNQSKLDNLLRQKKTDEVTTNSLKGRLEATQSTIEKIQSEVKVISDRRDATKESSKEVSKEIDQKKKEYNTFQSERVKVNQLRTDLEEKFQACLTELDNADDGRRENERERRTKETVSSLKRIYGGVRGRIGELCKPKQKKYEEAIAIALGRDFDAVVVDTEKTGIECVQYLKDQRAPPMTFIPLDNIKVSGINSNLKGLNKARLTIDTIDFDAAYERAMSYACSNSIVCDDIDTATDICYRRRIEVKAVTLRGEVISKGGNITGGRGPGQDGKRKFAEPQDVDNLRAKAEQYKKQIEDLPRTGRKSAAEEQLQSDLAGLEQRLAYAKDELAAFEKNLASKKKELAHEQRSLQELGPKWQEKQSGLASLQTTIDEFEDEIAQVEDDVFGGFCKRLGYFDIRSYEAQQGSLERESSEKRSDFELQKKRLETQLKWESDQHSDLSLRVQRLEETIAGGQRDVQTYTAEKIALENAIDIDNAQLTQLGDENNRMKEKLLAKAEKVTAARNELQKQSKEIDTRTKAIAVLEAEGQKSSAGRYALLRRCKMEQIAIPLTNESGKLDSLPVDDNILQTVPDAMDVDDDEEEVMKDYGIDVDFDDLNDVLRNPEEEGIEEQLDSKITTLNSELEKLNPNMRAIDRLDGVQSRLKDTDQEFEDARAVAKTKKDAFSSVKQKRFDLFNKAFTHISDQISHVYRDLTRSSAFPLGGQAYLDIEDSDAPYLSGIKYHAMPPLKRFRDMEHLSGGEKTMAALALLFAVHSYQPSPFFVLDEVDAALDNANVEKIRNYIREHAGPGMQFIVISLKTGLFQGSESLVGVYRDQEANSSKTLTLDLRKYA
ncbi:putative structural maintenance of chromosomes protein 1 [Calycina marina]|uniref:Structural maintenance of chromosomes protein n=1 Tax=Calycina marina TaxID=1763456 RepID=A0A9P7Z5C2_9HELO|nr:putative structural maintenance of chromosomes protein 1 [Calycina marina]